MRFATLFAAALSAVAVSAHFNETHPNPHTNGTKEIIVTETVKQYTTYCPLPTTFVVNNETYVVTEPAVVTVTNCPCTVTKTYQIVTETICPGGCEHPTAKPIPVLVSNGTVTPSGAPPNITAPVIPPPSEGSAASNRVALFGSAIAGFVAIAAFVL
ncbi:hypothetical protein DFH27DRAFT_522661 [Peziza echinospora]|nr:hypothetical protein DFH27DRAFT_522661 [Peziza echinospora]